MTDIDKLVLSEAAIAAAVVRRWYPSTKWAVCDRVSFGLGLSYEADVVAINENGLCDEVEIKTGAADLRRDLKKHKWKKIDSGRSKHFSDRFWYAVPEELAGPAQDQARPRGFGVVVVRRDALGVDRARRILKAKRLHPDSSERRQKMLDLVPRLQRLAMIRYWASPFWEKTWNIS